MFVGSGSDVKCKKAVFETHNFPFYLRWKDGRFVLACLRVWLDARLSKSLQEVVLLFVPGRTDSKLQLRRGVSPLMSFRQHQGNYMSQTHTEEESSDYDETKSRTFAMMHKNRPLTGSDAVASENAIIYQESLL